MANRQSASQSSAESATGLEGTKKRSVLEQWHLHLRSGHQRLIAVGVFLGLLFVTGYFSWLAAHHGGLVEIDAAPKIAFRFQVDVNHAEWSELFAIPGVGEKTARGIVEYRQANGRFKTIGDLEKVPGIGPKTIERIREYLLPID